MLNTSNDLRLDKQPIPVPGIPIIESYLSPISPPEISLLTNSFCWYLKLVFILHEKNNYRLIVIHNKKIVLDRTFKNLRGARISFSRQFNKPGCVKIFFEGRINGDPIWSHFYPPDQDWLDPILKLLDKHHSRGRHPHKRGTHDKKLR